MSLRSTRPYIRKKPVHGNSRPVVIVETGMEFPSIESCGEYIRAHPSGISNVLAGRRKTHKGYTFRWATPDGTRPE